VQGHGTSVTTTGFGDLFGDSQNDLYTAVFNGTSSASAIVAAAATTVQGYVKHGAHPVRTPQGMAILLKSTGSAQTGNTSERIGPKPNLRAAVAQLDGPVLAPSVSFVGCTGFAGTANIRVTTNADVSTLTVEKRPAGQGAWSVYATFQNDAAGTQHTLTVTTPGPQEMRAKSTDATRTPPDSPYTGSGSFDC